MTDMNSATVLSSLDFVEVLKQKFNENHDISVELNVTGNSMLPFLAENRDSVFLSVNRGKLKKGDIAMFVRKGKLCVLHRVKKTDENGYYFIGDCQLAVEGPIPETDIIAICRAVRRKGRVISEKNFTWLFFKYIWLNIIPYRHRIMAFISKLKHNNQ